MVGHHDGKRGAECKRARAQIDQGSVVYLPAAFIVFVLFGALLTRTLCYEDR